MKRKYEEFQCPDEVAKKKFHSCRLVLRNVNIDMTKPQVLRLFVEDFPDVGVYMPTKVHNKQLNIKLVFLDFQRPWQARVAEKLINLIKYNNVTASFADSNAKDDDDDDNMVPKLQIPTHALKATTLSMFPQGDIPSQGSCAYCQNSEASFVCDSCFTITSCVFYCNESHQLSHWPEHKFDCKALPKLVLPNEAALSKEKSKVKYIVRHVDNFKKGDLVVISHVDTKGTLFVRPSSTNADFEALVKKVTDFSQGSPFLTKKPELLDIVLAKKSDGTYARAQVHDIFESVSDGNNILVHFLEDGSEMKFRWKDFKNLNYKLRGEKRHTFKAVLKDVHDEFNSKAKDLLNQLMEKREKLEVIDVTFKGNVAFVVLKIQSSSEILNLKIQDINNGDALNVQEIFFEKSKIEKLPTGSNIKVRIIDSSRLEQGVISVMLNDSFDKFWEIDRKINEYGNMECSNEHYEPRLNEICLVNIGDRWERGCVEEIEDTIKMLLVDKFVVQSIPKENVRKLPTKFSSHFFIQLCKFKTSSGAYEPSQFSRNKKIIADLIEFDEKDEQFVLNFNI